MNWTIEYDKDRHFAKVNVEGVFNVSDHLRNIEELTLQEHWTPGLNILFDCINANFDNSSYQDVEDLAKNFIRNDLFVGCGKVALLMKSIVDFGKGRQFEMMTDEHICASVFIFFNEQQALRWLGT